MKNISNANSLSEIIEEDIQWASQKQERLNMPRKTLKNYKD